MARTAAQLAKMGEYVTAADRAGYYRLLAEYGDRYGELALGVVRKDPQLHDH